MRAPHPPGAPKCSPVDGVAATISHSRRGLAADVLSYYRGDVASVRQLRVDDSVPSIWCAKAAPRARLRHGNDAWVATCAKRCGSPWLKAAAGSSSSPRVRLHQQPPWSHARWNDDISAQQGLLLAWYNWARNLRCYTTSRMNLRARESDLLHNLHRGLGRAAPHGRHHVACFGQCMEHTCL